MKYGRLSSLLYMLLALILVVVATQVHKLFALGSDWHNTAEAFKSPLGVVRCNAKMGCDIDISDTASMWRLKYDCWWAGPRWQCLDSGIQDVTTFREFAGQNSQSNSGKEGQPSSEGAVPRNETSTSVEATSSWHRAIMTGNGDWKTATWGWARGH